MMNISEINLFHLLSHGLSQLGSTFDHLSMSLFMNLSIVNIIALSLGNFVGTVLTVLLIIGRISLIILVVVIIKLVISKGELENKFKLLISAFVAFIAIISLIISLNKGLLSYIVDALLEVLGFISLLAIVRPGIPIFGYLFQILKIKLLERELNNLRSSKKEDYQRMNHLDITEDFQRKQEFSASVRNEEFSVTTRRQPKGPSRPKFKKYDIAIMNGKIVFIEDIVEKDGDIYYLVREV